MHGPAKSVVVIGAGVSGLAAARALQQRGVSVSIYDKGRGVGGRCATRRWDKDVYDHGAQYFTARAETFQNAVEEAVRDGAVVEWCQGFPTETGTPRDDGHSRYRGAPCMTAFPKWLAKDLTIHTGHHATRIERAGDGCTVTFDTGEEVLADAVIVTPPVPQSIALLEGGGVEIPRPAREILDGIHYAPCFALMARLRAVPMIAHPGGMRPREGGPIAWIADNARKGISPTPCLTVHASVDFSNKYFDTDSEEVKGMLIEAVEHALGCEVMDAQLHRWRYAMPLTTPAEPCLVLSGPAPIVLAGDGFGGPKVEGAFLSGLAAAETLHSG